MYVCMYVCMYRRGMLITINVLSDPKEA
jgi:hypothetical protein